MKIFGMRVINSAISEDYVQWATDLLEAGFDSPNLRILAGLSKPLDPAQVENYFKKSLQDLDIHEPPQDKAIEDYSIILCEDILAGTIDPLYGMEQLYKIMVHLDYCSDYIIWLELHDAVIDVTNYRTHPYTYPEMNEDNIDEIIIKEAKKFLAYLKNRKEKRLIEKDNEETVIDSLKLSNKASWRRVEADYTDLLKTPNFKSRRHLLNLVRYIANSEIAEYFRACTSVWRLIISTSKLRGDGKDAYLIVDCYKKSFGISFWKTSYSTEKPLEFVKCKEKDIIKTLTPMLKRLWTETRKGDCPALGEALNEYYRSPWNEFVKILFGKRPFQ